MKQRISSLDLRLLARELKEQLEGYRLSNIYNIADSNRQFLLKFGKPDSKLNVVIDCGLRVHLTEFSRPIPPSPSGFVVKLRKHLKAKRLTTIKQVDNDRILVLSFSDGMYYLVLEFFSAGNVILLDSNRTILDLQRIVHEHENKVGQVYDMFDETFLDETGTYFPDLEFHTEESVLEWLKVADEKARIDAASVTAEGPKKQKKRGKIQSLHKLLFTHAPHLSSDLLSKNLKVYGLNPSSSCLDFKEQIGLLAEILNKTETEVRELLSSERKCGFIVAKRNPYSDASKGSADIEFIYEQFHPFVPFVGKDNENDGELKVIEIEGEYNKTLDAFFSTIESSKYALRIQNQEQQARKKLEDAKSENRRKIQALIDVQTSNEQKGNTIIANADLVEEAKYAVQGLVDQQMDWNTIEKLVKNEQSRKNKVAQLIQLPLNLENNKIKLVLPLLGDGDDLNSGSDSDSDSDSNTESSDDNLSDDDTSSSDESEVSDFETEEGIEKVSPKEKKENSRKNFKKGPDTIVVTVDLSLSAYANASNYFNIKKSSIEKQKKVEQNVQKAMKNIEQKIKKDLKKKLKDSHDVLKKIRTPYFFEKYNWFISSEGFLVMMGKSGPETDQIFSKFITDNDVYVSNDYGTQVWIKNPNNTEVPPNTLMQAGIFAMSSSDAWSKKIASSPWWCFAKNISKFDPVDNSVLPPGAFDIKKDNQKNHMPPAQLVMGFAFLWKVKTAENEDDVFGQDLEEEDDENDAEYNGQNEKEEAEEAEGREEEVLEREVSGILSDVAVDDISKELEEIEISHGDFEDVKRAIDEDVENDDSYDDNLETNTMAASVVENMNKKVRGKRGKLKKMQKKYGDQDEEERQLRLQVLGTLKGVEKEQKKKEEEVTKQQERQAKKQRREKQKRLQALKFTAKEKVNVNYSKIFNELKPLVEKDDEILDIVPVFAPWAALSKYKYKVKVQPGSAKKTKSINEILNYFNKRKVDSSESDKEADWPREHELIKPLKEQELVPLFCVDKLKITVPGQNETKSKNRNDKNAKGGKKGGKGKKNK